MFLFALKMQVADLKRVLKWFWWLAPIMLILIVIAPFCDAEMYKVIYLIYITLSFFLPRYSKIHFVVPLDEKQIKRYFLWRIAIVCGMIILIAMVIIGISMWLKWEVAQPGYLMVACYLLFYLLEAAMGLPGIGSGINKFGVRHLIAIGIGVVSLCMGMILVDYLPVNGLVVMVLIMLALATGYMLWFIKKVKIEDYVYVPLGFWENGKKERD